MSPASSKVSYHSYAWVFDKSKFFQPSQQFRICFFVGHTQFSRLNQSENRDASCCHKQSGQQMALISSIVIKNGSTYFTTKNWNIIYFLTQIICYIRLLILTFAWTHQAFFLLARVIITFAKFSIYFFIWIRSCETFAFATFTFS